MGRTDLGRTLGSDWWIAFIEVVVSTKSLVSDAMRSVCCIRTMTGREWSQCFQGFKDVRESDVVFLVIVLFMPDYQTEAVSEASMSTQYAKWMLGSESTCHGNGHPESETGDCTRNLIHVDAHKKETKWCSAGRCWDTLERFATRLHSKWHDHTSNSCRCTDTRNKVMLRQQVLGHTYFASCPQSYAPSWMPHLFASFHDNDSINEHQLIWSSSFASFHDNDSINEHDLI